jgi:hypothetical protein
MYNTHWGDGAQYGYGGVGMEPGWLLGVMAITLPLFILLLAWMFVWKGLALWHSARRGQYWWFLILLVVNTFGILELVYLFGVAKLKFNELFSPKEHHTHHH